MKKAYWMIFDKATHGQSSHKLENLQTSKFAEMH